MSADLSPEAVQLARRLAEPGVIARLSLFGCGRLALQRAAGATSLGAGFASQAAAEELVSHGLARWTGSSGNRLLELAATRNAERELAPARISIDGCTRSVLVDLRESPLLWLRRRPGKDGRQQISDEQFAAGERFRADLTTAAMLPRTTMNWDAAHAPDEAGSRANDRAWASDAAVAARQRVRKACDRLGPDLSGLAMDVCGFLKGLDQVERERGWPARSAKVVLRVALGQLAEHYGISTSQRGGPPRASVWRAPDATPGIAPPA